MSGNRKVTMGLLYGDATGIGSELVAKALQNQDLFEDVTWVLIGDERVFQLGAEIANCSLQYRKIESIDQIDPNEETTWLIDTANTDPLTLPLGKLSAESGKATGDNLTLATRLAQNKKLDGVVYAPLNKGALYKGGYQFEDDIHLLASLFDYKSGFGEVNVLEDLWVTRVTSHIPMKEVAQHITKSRVLEVIRFANVILKKKLVLRTRGLQYLHITHMQETVV